MKYFFTATVIVFTLFLNCHAQEVQQEIQVDTRYHSVNGEQHIADNINELIPETSIDREFSKLFVLGFLETFLFYYSCDLRVDWNMQNAFFHCLAGGLVVASASRLGPLPKLTLKDWTKKEVLKHVLSFFGIQMVARLFCMMKLISHHASSQDEEFKSKFITGYDATTYLLLTVIPLLKRRALRGNSNV